MATKRHINKGGQKNPRCMKYYRAVARLRKVESPLRMTAARRERARVKLIEMEGAHALLMLT